MVGFLAEGTEESDGGPPECGDEVCRNPQAEEPGMGPIQGIGPDLVNRSWHQGEGRCGPDPPEVLGPDFQLLVCRLLWHERVTLRNLTVDRA